MLRQRRARREIDMLNGPLLPRILLFAGPLMLTGILQLLFNAADIIVVGRFAADGEYALAAVSSTSPLINLLINVFMGLSVGAGVLVARLWGARDGAGVSRAVHTALTVAVAGGFIVAAAGFFLAGPMLRLMDCPENVLGLAALYLKIYFLGMPVNMVYTFGAAILRAVGDTRRPLYYLMIAGVVNVALNLVLVLGAGMSVAGVAIATVASQAVSMVLVVLCLCRTSGPIHLDFRRLRVDGRSLADILRVGLPAGLQGSLFSISNVLIQSSVYSFGAVTVAGSGAASNIEGFVYVAMNSLCQASLTFAGQNAGAGKPDRVRRVMVCCLLSVAALGLALGLGVLALGRPLLSVYVSGASENYAAILDAGMKRMSVILPTYFLCGMMDVMVGQLRGTGCSLIPMIVSLTGVCLFRVVWIFLLFRPNPSVELLFWSYPASWLLTLAAHLVTWFAVSPKLLKRAEALQ